MKFKRKHPKTEVNDMSTAALPDIVFMLLFFFMVTTVMRTEEPMVLVDRPEANEIVKIEDASSCVTIFVGQKNHLDNNSKIQIGKELVNLIDIGTIVSNHVLSLPENIKSKFTVIIKADKNVQME